MRGQPHHSIQPKSSESINIAALKQEFEVFKKQYIGIGEEPSIFDFIILKELQGMKEQMNKVAISSEVLETRLKDVVLAISSLRR